MTGRQQLSNAQIMAMFDPPTLHHELVSHYTLSEADLAPIRQCRGDHNRLGHALMLCYLPPVPRRRAAPEPLRVRLYASVGAALIINCDQKRSGFGAIAEVIDWKRFCASVAVAEKLARPAESDAYQELGELFRYPALVARIFLGIRVRIPVILNGQTVRS